MSSYGPQDNVTWLQAFTTPNTIQIFGATVKLSWHTLCSEMQTHMELCGYLFSSQQDILGNSVYFWGLGNITHNYLKNSTQAYEPCQNGNHRTHTHACTKLKHTHTRMHTYMYTHTWHICTHTDTHTETHTHTHTHTHSAYHTSEAVEKMP